jgi:hypothetical protein
LFYTIAERKYYSPKGKGGVIGEPKVPLNKIEILFQLLSKDKKQKQSLTKSK